jgi:hypothetical protein
MIGNCESFARTIATNQPPDLGVVVILFNRRTGHVVMRSPDTSRKQTDAILKGLIERPNESNLIVPPGSFRT